MRRAVSAGEALPASVAEQYRDVVGHALIDGIGGTEMLHVFISAADTDARPGATGRVVPGFHAVVLDLDGCEVPDGTPGLLAVCGPTGCRYLDDPRQTEYVRHGWNMTVRVDTADVDAACEQVARSYCPHELFRPREPRGFHVRHEEGGGAELAVFALAYGSDRVWVLPVPFADKLDLSRFYALELPKSYINATEDTALPPGEWGPHPRMSSRLGLYRLVQLPGSHEVMFTAPERLADAIVAAGRD
ncbi:AMP-binding protein [Pseudonocardia asaccharolytica]|uniref:AMP-dependent synthetase/ligase domain-containing protein n=1 Tax=Pseudonocardia asaccharolytica DSM 44247 = NBRC 16224 TaxID=1123024 RepID=A0A511CWB7_9PSEU|nr:hypothetical protein PA7_06040 [Pseudonocardia asaccharolytica DSM 44247 = NBRC 16224]